MNRSRSLVSAALIVLLAGAVPAFAQDASLADDQVTARLGFIAGALEAGQPRARTWWYGWIGGCSAGAIAMGILSATSWKAEVDNSFAQDMLVGGATAALGAVGLVIDPFDPVTAARRLRRLPETTSLERRAKLERAEELLRECARRERAGRGLTTHLLNVGVNAAAGAVTAAAFKRPWTDGLVTFAAGEAVSLLNIFTQPMRATRDLRKYESGSWSRGAPVAAARPDAVWSLGFWPGGVSFRMTF